MSKRENAIIATIIFQYFSQKVGLEMFAVLVVIVTLGFLVVVSSSSLSLSLAVLSDGIVL